MTNTPEWQHCIASIIESPGLVVVVGESDTGKSTFCAELVNAAAAVGLKTVVVDADVGQSEIGPPGTVGLAGVSEPVARLSDLHVRRMYYVGAVSPVGNTLQTVIGVKKMADEARAHGAQLIVVDTSGLVQGAIGRKLKTYKIDLLSPDHVVFLQKTSESEHLVKVISALQHITIHKLNVSSSLRSKSSDFRAARRKSRLAQRFDGAESHVIRLEDVTFWGSWLYTGRQLPWQRLRALERILKVKILNAETVGRGYYLVVDRTPLPSDVLLLEEELKIRGIAIVPAAAFTHAYVGLADARGHLLDVGIVQAIEFRQKYMSVITPLKSIAPVRIVQFGAMRVSRDGTELVRLRVGEI